MTKVGQKLPQATFPVATSQRLVAIMMMMIRWRDGEDGEDLAMVMMMMMMPFEGEINHSGMR